MKEKRPVPMGRPKFREHPGPTCPTHGAYHQALDACPLCAGVPLPDLPMAPALAPCCQLALRQAVAKWPADKVAASRAKGEVRANGIATPRKGFHGLCPTCQRSVTWDGTQWRRSGPNEHRYTVEG